MPTSRVSAVVGLSVVASARGVCPANLPPYSSEPSPFGWPVTPSEWEFAHPECWAEKYPACGGHRQSPMDIRLNVPGACNSSTWEGHTLDDRIHYKVLPGRPTVYLSKYMRAASVVGDLGSLVLKSAAGDVEFVAVQAYLTAGSLHTVNGQGADAELLVVHKPKGAPDGLSGSVVVSVRFRATGWDRSQLFDQMGITTTAADEGPKWRAPGSVDIGSIVVAAARKAFYSYDGSVPVPPCSETVRYIVLEEEQPVHLDQVAALKDLLTTHTGHFLKRPAVSRSGHGECRVIAAQSLSFEALATSDFAPQCSSSPIDASVGNANRMLPRQSAASLMAYKLADHVTVSRSDYAVEVAGDFGGLMLNGRLFEAKKILIRPVAQHTFNGTRHVAELIVQNSLFGESFGVAHRRLEEETSATEDEDPDDAEDAVEAGIHHGPHEVMLSVPFKLGRQSPLLLAMGLGNNEHASAIRSGNAYDMRQTAINLAADLAASTSQPWYWYSGGPIAPGVCPAWGVKWMLFQEPLEMSLEQLNALVVPISGMDSTTLPRHMLAQLFANAVPAEAVEEQGWVGEAPICSAGEQQSPIDIPTASISKVGEDNFLAKASWKPVRGLRLVNEGGHLSMSSKQFGYFTVTAGPNGYPKYYQLVDVRLRMPSEHMIDGKQYAAELQMVHKNQKTVLSFEDSDVVIASFLFDLGEESALLRQLLPSTLPMKEGQHATLEDPIDFMWALGPSMDSPFYVYQGSHTTPGCEEVAQWFVFERPMTLSRPQWQDFKAIFSSPSANRPVQPLNGRRLSKSRIEEYEPVDVRYFLNRKFGRDKSETPVGYIILPILGTITLCTVMMTAIFQREDRSTKEVSAGGVQGAVAPTTVGKGYRRI